MFVVTDEDEIELPQTFKVQDVGSGGMFGSWFMSADQKAARKKSKEESEKDSSELAFEI